MANTTGPNSISQKDAVARACAELHGKPDDSLENTVKLAEKYYGKPMGRNVVSSYRSQWNKSSQEPTNKPNGKHVTMEFLNKNPAPVDSWLNLLQFIKDNNLDPAKLADVMEPFGSVDNFAQTLRGFKVQ